MPGNSDRVTTAGGAPHGRSRAARARSLRRRTKARAEARLLTNCVDLPIEVAVAVRLELGEDAYPVLERTTVPVPAGTGRTQSPASAGTPQTGWLLASGDRRQRVLLLPSKVVARSADHEDSSARTADSLSKALASLAAINDVLQVQRVGLHRSTRLTSPDAVDPTFWADHIRPGFHGLLLAQHPAQLRWAHLQSAVRLDSWTVARIHGELARDGVGAHAFMLGLVVLHERAFRYEAGSFATTINKLGAYATELNRQAFASPTDPSPRRGREAPKLGGVGPIAGRPRSRPEKGAAPSRGLFTVMAIDENGRPADPVSAIRYLASVLQWPQDAVCRAVGVPRRTYYGWKTRGHKPNQARLTRLWATVDAIHAVQRTRPELVARIAQDQQASACLAAGDLTGFNNAVEEIARRSAPAGGT